MAENLTDFTKRIDASKFDVATFGGSRIPRLDMNDPATIHGLAEAQQFVNRMMEGRYTLRDFREAMGTSDFPLYFATNLQRQMLGMYQATPSSWEMWALPTTVNDFRELKLDYLTGGDGRLTSRKELAEAPQGSLGEGQYSVAVEIYDRALGLSEEAIRNDDLNAFASIPKRLGRGAKRTEEYLATTMIAGASGPNATLFTSGHNNLITRALSVQGLDEATAKLATQTDTGGEPIYNEPAVLAVVPALKATALQLLNALQVEKTQGNEKTVARNQYSNLKLAVLYYAPTVMTSANSATTWFLFPDPNAGESAAVTVAHLRGMEQPGIFSKAPNAISVGGGGYDIVDFDTNTQEWKVKHVVGAAQLDYRCGVGSNGTVAAGA